MADNNSHSDILECNLSEPVSGNKVLYHTTLMKTKEKQRQILSQTYIINKQKPSYKCHTVSTNKKCN